MRTNNKAVVYDFESFFRNKKEHEENMEKLDLFHEALKYLTVDEFEELIEFLGKTDNMDEKEKELTEILESRELLKTRFDFRFKRRKNIAVYSLIS